MARFARSWEDIVTGGDIAGLIAAGIFAVLVGLLAVPLIKLGRVFDETSTAIRELSDSVSPLLEEATTTISETNKQLARVDSITSSVEEATSNVSSLVALFAATLGGPLIKIAGFSAGVRAAITGLRRGPKSSPRTK
jgi:predicted PurR-regulated permease PerM